MYLDHYNNESGEGHGVIHLMNCHRIERSKSDLYMFELWCDCGKLVAL